MSPFEHGEVFVLDDGGEVTATSCSDRHPHFLCLLLPENIAHSFCHHQLKIFSQIYLLMYCSYFFFNKDWCGFFVLFCGWLESFPFSFLKVDLDLGNYERFLDIKLTRDHNITTGKIYQVTGFGSPNPCAIRTCLEELVKKQKTSLEDCAIQVKSLVYTFLFEERGKGFCLTFA